MNYWDIQNVLNKKVSSVINDLFTKGSSVSNQMRSPFMYYPKRSGKYVNNLMTFLYKKW